MLTTETRQHLIMAELARNRFVLKVGKEIYFVQSNNMLQTVEHSDPLCNPQI